MTTSTQKNSVPSAQSAVNGSAETVQRIPLVDLLISERNTRHPKPNEPGIGELALSIKNAGQTTPVIARAHPKHKGKFEIAAGARRLVAAGVAGLKDLACVVRQLDDNAFEELILIENLQREDPDPRAEVELIDRLVKRGLHTAEQISAHLGKPKHWASRRIQLLKVIPEIRKQWANATGNSNTSLAHFGVEMMELVGSLPIDTQKMFLDQHAWQLRRCTSRADLQRALNEHVFCRLDQAPFDLNDKRFFVRGCGPGCACDSSALQSLFSDGKKEPPRCLNLGCFRQRLALANKVKFEELRGKEDLPVITTEYRSSNYIQIGDKQIKVEDIRHRGLGHPLTKPEKGAQKVIVVGSDNSFRIGYMPKHRAPSGTGSRGPVKSPAARLTERKNILQGKRLHLVHGDLEKALRESKHTDCTENIVDLVTVFGLPFCEGIRYGGDSSIWRKFDAVKKDGYPFRVAQSHGYNPSAFKAPASGNAKHRDAPLWHALKFVFADVMKPVGNVGDAPKHEKDMRRVAKLISFPFDERKRAADEKIRPPKTWGPVDLHTLEPRKSAAITHHGLSAAGRKKLGADRITAARNAWMELEVADPKGLTRNRNHLKTGARFKVKRKYQNVNVARWLKEGRLREVKK